MIANERQAKNFLDKNYLTNTLQDQHSNKLQLHKIRLDEPNYRFPTSNKYADVQNKEIDPKILYEQSIQIRKDQSENSYIQDRLLEPVVYTSLQNNHLKYDFNPDNSQRILLEPSLQPLYEQKTPFVYGFQSNQYSRDMNQRYGNTKQSPTERLDDKTHIHQLTKAMSKHYSKTLSKLEADIRENSERINKQQTLFQSQGYDLENIGRDVVFIGKKIEAQDKRLDSLKHLIDSQGLEIEFIVAMFRKYELQIKHHENILKGIARKV